MALKTWRKLSSALEAAYCLSLAHFDKPFIVYRLANDRERFGVAAESLLLVDTVPGDRIVAVVRSLPGCYGKADMRESERFRGKGRA